MDRPDSTGLEQFTSGTLEASIRSGHAAGATQRVPRRPRDIDDDDDDDEYKYLTDLTYFRGDADARMGRFTRLLHAERC